MKDKDLYEIVDDLFYNYDLGETDRISLVRRIANKDFTSEIFTILLRVGLLDDEENVRRNTMEMLFEILSHRKSMNLENAEEHIRILIHTFSYDKNESTRAQVLAFASNHLDKEYFLNFIDKFKRDSSKWVKDNVKYLIKRLNN